jgi:phenylacetic acid degradation operon negative regulatory protein
VHPRDRTARLSAAAKELRVTDRMTVFRGVSDQSLVHQAWDLAAVAARYRAFIRRFTPIVTAKCTPREAFGLRFAFMFEFFRISWDDPALPHALLPADWPGEKARRLASTLTKKLGPDALKFGRSVFSDRGERVDTHGTARGNPGSKQSHHT